MLGENEVAGGPREGRASRSLAAVEFAEASPEPALDTLYENLYVLDSDDGWYAVDERSPEPHRGEREEESMPDGGARAGRGGRRLRGPAGRARAQPGRSTATPSSGSSPRSPRRSRARPTSDPEEAED